MDVNERVAQLEVKMNRVEEGVANFRDFQRDAREFFTEHRVLAKEMNRQREERDKQIKDALATAERRQNSRLSMIGLALAVLTLFCGAIAALEAWHQLKTGEIVTPQIFSQTTQNQEYSLRRDFEIAHW